jgi:pilus assembly protein Flp/PilA
MGNVYVADFICSSIYSGVVIMMQWLQHLRKTPGQGLVEYALILVLVAVVVIIMLSLIGGGIGNIFSNIVSTL